MHSKVSLIVLAVALGLLYPGIASADVEVRLSHKDTPDNTITQVFSVADGEKIKVIITDTDTTKFECEATGIVVVPSVESADGDRAQEDEDTKLCEVTIENSAKYGGYYVKIKLIDGEDRPDAPKGRTWKDRTWIVATQETGWHTDIQAGLAGSGLVSPEYFLDTGEDGVKRVLRDREAEDDVEFGFASFATVYHDRKPQWGGSLGLGINDNDLSVLLGVTRRFGKRAAITAGYGWGQVDRLPTGLTEGDSFDEDNLTLEKATRGDWFFSISVRGFTDAFQKKLATATQKKQ